LEPLAHWVFYTLQCTLKIIIYLLQQHIPPSDDTQTTTTKQRMAMMQELWQEWFNIKLQPQIKIPIAQ
jgi:hypothetical protein